MLNVKTLDEAISLCNEKFYHLKTKPKTVSLYEALGKVVYSDIYSDEYIPGFDRSTVDGIAIKAQDSFGCSDTMPALLKYKGEIPMGKTDAFSITSGECYGVSTGGMLPANADAVVMVENIQDYGDGFRYVFKSVSPRENVINKGDDVFPDKLVIKSGTRLSSREIGALAAMGCTKIKIYNKPIIGIISTGDEVIAIDKKPSAGVIRDVNTHMLKAAVNECNGIPLSFGIVKDDEEMLFSVIKEALKECDILLVSGGSSAGEKDITKKIIEKMGKLYLHGLAVKPGKPTIIGSIDQKPVFGLPGHPVSAYFIFLLLIKPLISTFNNTKPVLLTKKGILDVNIPSNNGREEYVPVKFKDDNNGSKSKKILPVPIKSGLITLLCEADGYVKIPRNKEGLYKGQETEVFMF